MWRCSIYLLFIFVDKHLSVIGNWYFDFLLYFIISSTVFLMLFFFFLFFCYWLYLFIWKNWYTNTVLVPGVQHCDSIFMCIIKWSPQCLVTTCHHTDLLQYYWPYSLCCTLCPHELFILNWKCILLNPLHIFHPFPPSLSLLAATSSLFQLVCFVLFCSFVLLFRFHIWVKSYDICLSDLFYFT